MNKILIKEYKKLIKNDIEDSLSIYFKLKGIDEKLNLKKYSEYEKKFLPKKLKTNN